MSHFNTTSTHNTPSYLLSLAHLPAFARVRSALLRTSWGYPSNVHVAAIIPVPAVPESHLYFRQ